MMWLISKKIKKTAIGYSTLLALVALINIYRFISTKYLNIVFIQDIGPLTQIITFSLLCFCFFLKDLLRCTVGRSIEIISNVTYSLYLIHVSVGLFLISRLRHDIDNPYLLLTSVTILVTIISAITYQFIEKPGNVLGKRLVSQI
jgi:peptidoglycan/LPS O-acetylase OafA/YrhL